MKLLKGYAAIALNWGIAWAVYGEWAAWTGVGMAAVYTVLMAWLWLATRDEREIARQVDYVPGQPLVWTRRYSFMDEPVVRQVTYVGAGYTGHYVDGEGDVRWIAMAEDLVPAPLPSIH